MQGTANFLMGNESFLLKSLRVSNLLSNLVIFLLIALVFLGLRSKGKCFILRFLIVLLTEVSFPSTTSLVSLVRSLEMTSCFLFSLMMVRILAICFLSPLIFESFDTAVPVTLVNLIVWSSSLSFYREWVLNFVKNFLHLLRWSYGFYFSVCWCGISHW